MVRLGILNHEVLLFNTLSLTEVLPDVNWGG